MNDTSLLSSLTRIFHSRLVSTLLLDLELFAQLVLVSGTLLPINLNVVTYTNLSDEISKLAYFQTLSLLLAS